MNCLLTGKLSITKVLCAPKYLLQVAKSTDLGSNDRLHTTITHLGHLLKAGDNALGYDLTAAQLSDPVLESYLQKGMHYQDVILVSFMYFFPSAVHLAHVHASNARLLCQVRKSYEEKRRRRRLRGRQRPWQLKRMAAGSSDEPESRGKGRHAGGCTAAREEADKERFMEVIAWQRLHTACAVSL